MWFEKIEIENFRAISRALFADLPSRGLIAVTGGNEAGKSSFLEAICFALYGRSLQAGVSVAELIQWGTERVVVELVLHAGEETVVLRREADHQGKQRVLLRNIAGTGGSTTDIAEVRQWLDRLGIPPFPVFKRIFCFQEPFETGAAASDLLEEIGGIHALNEAEETIRRELDGREHEYGLLSAELERKHEEREQLRLVSEGIEEAEKEFENVHEEFSGILERKKEAQKRSKHYGRCANKFRQRIKALRSLDEKGVSELRQELDKTERFFKESIDKVGSDINQYIDPLFPELDALRRFIPQYEECRSEAEARLREGKSGLERDGEELHALRNKFKRVHLGQRVTAVAVLASMAVAVGALWRLFSLPGVSLKELFSELPPLDPGNITSNPSGLLYAGGAALCLCLVALSALIPLIVRQNRVNKRIAEAEERESAQAREVADFEAALEKEEAHLKDWASVRDTIAPDRSFVLDAPLEAVFELADAMEAVEKRITETADENTRIVTAEKKAFKGINSKRSRAEGVYREKQEAVARLEKLDNESMKLEEQIASSQEGIDINLLALDMLDEAVSQIRVKLVPALHGYLKRFVASCTGTQYREIRYSADHTLSVFSSEKGDFLSPAEQSRTIRDGLALCMQAAAAGLVSESRPEPRFLFFDYAPFSSFDKERKATILNRLTDEEAFSQIFLFLQEIPPLVQPQVREALENGVLGDGARSNDRALDTDGGGDHTVEQHDSGPAVDHDSREASDGTAIYF